MSGFAAALKAKTGIENYDSQEVTKFLSTGYPVLDHLLSGKYHQGGLASARIVEMMGPSSSGKTAIATQIMKEAQKKGGIAGFHDHEGTFDKGLGASFGLSLDPDHWFYDKPTTFESSIDLMRETILFARGMEFRDGDYKTIKGAEIHYPIDIPFAWVFDSLASMVPMSAAVKSATERNMNDNTALSRATAAHFPALATFAEKTNTCILFLNHSKQKFGSDPRYPQFVSPGGDAPIFFASTRIQLARKVIVDPKEAGKKIGQTIRCEVVKNKIVYPFQKCEWNFMFMPDGTGRFDVTSGVIDELKELGLLETSGAYIVWDGKKLYKSQLVELIDTTPGMQERLIGLLPADV